ncbi:hypothetical protein P4A93_23785 [Pseudomonas syringae pv. syringae]|uniref:hypothetical protein n=1 Tax=Pseudomonas syringae TaxID=317 RepID=UPI0023F629C2|nr:hypothetical protein [Pseudomonas syringae]MDF5894634.1 hypothetical protein [Pseudomonas syringae pv. syringae]
MSDQEAWLTTVLSVGGMLATVVTAVATIFLWRVTKLLAKETTRMVEASDQPHVVAILSPNRWSLRHFDLVVDNTGNATAYDIQIRFNPPLENGEARKEDAIIPFRNVSVLKPGQGLRSYLADINVLTGKAYEVSVSWRRGSNTSLRETNAYTLDMADFAGRSELGLEPTIVIARSLEGLEKGMSRLTGSKHIKVDIYTALDRSQEKRRAARALRRMRQSRAAFQAPQNHPTPTEDPKSEPCSE